MEAFSELMSAFPAHVIHDDSPFPLFCITRTQGSEHSDSEHEIVESEPVKHEHRLARCFRRFCRFFGPKQEVTKAPAEEKKKKKPPIEHQYWLVR